MQPIPGCLCVELPLAITPLLKVKTGLNTEGCWCWFSAMHCTNCQLKVRRYAAQHGLLNNKAVQCLQ